MTDAADVSTRIWADVLILAEMNIQHPTLNIED